MSEVAPAEDWSRPGAPLEFGAPNLRGPQASGQRGNCRERVSAKARATIRCVVLSALVTHGSSGDVVVEFNNRPIESADQLKLQVAEISATCFFSTAVKVTQL